jgi:hypothetical protein
LLFEARIIRIRELSVKPKLVFFYVFAGSRRS